MKVGIITFQRATNYGAVLQAYALQTKIRSMDVEAYIVDYRNDRVDRMYSCFFPKVLFGKGVNPFVLLKRLVKGLLNLHENRLKRRIFDDFLERYLCRTQKFESFEELRRVQKEFDYFICGSDQVWNLGVTDNDPVYFLKFTTEKKKIAYAASLGTQRLLNEKVEIYKNYLSDFSMISVRERTSEQLLHEITGKEVKYVLDPTLLFRDEWIKCCEPVAHLENTNYILFYELYDMKNKALQTFTKRLSEILNLKIVHIGKNKYFKGKKVINIVPKPDQWVWLVMNARYVVTNSFHGTAFSINFNRPFFTGLLLPEDRPANVRMRDLLAELGLESRILDYESCYNNIGLDEEIDWKNVEAKLLVLKKNSEVFLSQVLGKHEVLNCSEVCKWTVSKMR